MMMDRFEKVDVVCLSEPPLPNPLPHGERGFALFRTEGLFSILQRLLPPLTIEERAGERGGGI